MGGDADSHPGLEAKARKILRMLPANQCFDFAYMPNGFIDPPS